MQHISFYKDRLPFHPRSNVVIYFDVTGISAKRYYNLIITHYELIEAEFRRGGLEFCFLPKIAHDMDLRKIYRYFNPQASEGEFRTDVSMYDDSDLLNYIVADYNSQSFAPGIIQYMGEEFDQEDTYTFAYTPLTYNFGDSPFELIRQYVKLHGVSRNLFSKNEDHEWEYLEHSALDEEHLVGESFNFEPSGLFPPIQDDINRYYEENDVDMMMSEVQMLVERLRRSGIGEVAIRRLFKPTQELSRLHIKYGRITLPDYNNMEIKMPTLSKAIFFLYLRHPEGIHFSYLPDYRDELLHLYSLISGRDNPEEIRKSIDDVTDPTSNSINEKCSRIKQAFLREFDDSIARNYYITGERGEAKKIMLPREKVTWDMPN